MKKDSTNDSVDREEQRCRLVFLQKLIAYHYQPVHYINMGKPVEFYLPLNSTPSKL